MANMVSSTEERRAAMAQLSPRRLAMKYDPPTIILEYPDPADDAARGYLHYKVRLRHLEPGMDPERVTRRVFARHPRSATRRGDE